jgi:hypothetical protein
MITGTIKSQIDQIRNAFRTGGISNPLEVIEQITCDLSLNRYKEVVHEAVEHRAPKEILADFAKLEEEIQRGMKELEGMLG